MLTRSVARPFLVLLFVFATACAGFALANAGVLSGAGVQPLVPSGAPPLLGAINELGRKGWACAPERAAGAKSARAAELPDIP